MSVFALIERCNILKAERDEARSVRVSALTADRSVNELIDDLRMALGAYTESTGLLVVRIDVWANIVGNRGQYGLTVCTKVLK